MIYLIQVFTLVIFQAVYGMEHFRKLPTYHQKSKLCAELATFTPNMCQYSAALQLCPRECDITYKQKLNCGKRHGGITKRIVGGTPAKRGSYPWHVSLRINNTQWCSGSILSKHFILTAAHCFDRYTSTKAKDWKIFAGDHYLSKTDLKEQQVQVKKILLHPKFSFSFYGKYGVTKDWVIVHNDIAILQLSSPIQLDDMDKSPICLPDQNKKIPALYECNIVGWGHTAHSGKQSEELREAKVFTVPNPICNLPHVYNGTVKPDELLCAGYEKGGIDACNYDSGGAMTCQRNGRWYATGIVSSGHECARPHSYGLYTNVDEYVDWIVDAILTQAHL